LTGKGRVEFSEALEVARALIKQYTEDTGIDKVFIIYNEFKSVLSQRVVLEQQLPVVRSEAGQSRSEVAAAGGADRLHLRAATSRDVWRASAAGLSRRRSFARCSSRLRSEQGARMTREGSGVEERERTSSSL
jgi:F0F1-type ATP synthase gamma subunit